MIFILHYILLNVGLPAIIILITLFLHTHSQASLTEIGALLMALPFVSIVTKPLFCALADRHQAHKQYLMASLAFMALGYGSLVIAPFFPEFVREHGRLVWYLDILGIIVGFGAFGIVWSLGDALAVNGAQMAGVSWGSYRLWAVISWGVFGALIGLINELPFLPAYVPGMLMLVISLLIEIVLLAVWPNDRFVMCAHLDNQIIKPEHQGHHYNNTTSQPSKTDEHQMAEFEEYYWPASKSHDGTLTMSMAGTLSAPPKVLGAVANIFMEDVGDTLKSTLKMGSRGAPRKGLSEILGEEGLTGFGAGTATGLGGATRPELDRAKSNESAQSVRSGNKLAAGVAAAATVPSLIHVTTTITDLPPIVDDIKQEQQQQQVEQEKADIKSGTGNNTGSRAVALSTSLSNSSTAVEPPAPRSAEDIQLFLLKLIVRRDKTIGKYLVLFTLFGLLMMCHISYFYMNVRQLCSLRNESFALISGAMMLAHAVSEVTSFLLVPRYIPWAGRVGALMTCAALYLVRFLYYGLWLNQLPTYYGIPFEFCHGLSYGIIYSLICDIAVECVDQVDEFLPELIAGGLVRADIRPSELKSPLRATMQGVFSGAFDGLGNGLGALCGGIFLDSYPFERLWQVCAGVCLVILVIYPLTEWQTLVGGGGGRCRRRRSTVK